MPSRDKIHHFYRNGFKEAEIHRIWPRLWNKHFRIVLEGSRFVKLNRFRDSLGFESLRRFCQPLDRRSMGKEAVKTE